MPNLKRLPKPVIERYEWQFHAACMGMETQVFFSPEAERGAARQMRERGAKAICDTCPVIEQCRHHALTVREPYGVWGGLTERERERLLVSRTAS
jgi:WhiB family redox-sensing transcriptional regulator